jgi:bifunctional UDP-N-acetylglucosamine pyrophosphorylase / glucosamine-1-phosphate N-acetyltransferase
MQVSVIVLAAGQGTRMNSDLPKVLHHVAAAPLLVHAMRTSSNLQPERTIVVVGHGGEAVAKVALEENPDANVVQQSEQLGTGHAVLQALPALEGFTGKVIVLYGIHRRCDRPRLSHRQSAPALRASGDGR